MYMQVINVTELVTPLREKSRQDKLEKLKAEETAKAISLVANKLKGMCSTVVCVTASGGGGRMEATTYTQAH